MPTEGWNERFRYPSDKLFLSWVSRWDYTILYTNRPAFISQLISYSKFWFETNTVALIACSRLSDSRPREKHSQGKKKNEGRLEGKGGDGVQLNSLPTYRRALLSERLEQAIALTLTLIINQKKKQS